MSKLSHILLHRSSLGERLDVIPTAVMRVYGLYEGGKGFTRDA